MKKLLSYFILIIPLTIFFVSAFWYYQAPPYSRSGVAISPLPNFLTLSENQQVRLLDFWAPVVQSIYGSEGDLPELTAQSVLTYDFTSNKALYEKEPSKRLPMASLTKIMTAIIALENQRSDNLYIVKGADLVGEDSMGLTIGESLTMEELLYGLMLPSGNDAAEVLASNYPAGRQAFIQAMNDKAKVLGLKDTHFTNPSGLQGDGEQHTTTYDLLVMTRYALEHYPLFAEIVATPEHTILATDTHKGYQLVNETNLLTTYPGVKGVKTGFTPEAGLCLVTLLDYGDHKIIGVILNSQNRRDEMKQLLDYSLKKLTIDPPPFKEGI